MSRALQPGRRRRQHGRGEHFRFWDRSELESLHVMNRPLAFTFVFLTATACAETRPCSETPDSPACEPWICCVSPEEEGCDPVEIAARCEPRDAGGDADAGDGGGLDAGLDAGDDSGPDAGPCGGGCSGETPLCDEGRNVCVCTTDHGSCTSPGAARCNEGVCVSCNGSGQCDGIGDTEVCDTVAGECVECLHTDDCGAGESCNLLLNTCEPEPTPVRRTCESCTNDDQCPVQHRCIRMLFDGVDRDPGYYCLRELDAPGECPRPFRTGSPPRASLNGAASESYCTPDEDLVSCEAARGILDDWRCDAGVDGRCYPPGEPAMAIDIPGARCETFSGGGVRCTYSCGNVVALCPEAGPGSTCGLGGTAEPAYCGG